VAELVGNPRDGQSLTWCHLNDEGDLLAEIPGAVQVSGKDSDESKEEKFLAFARGEIRVLVTKPKIGAWGLNFQNCAHVTTFPSHSFEQYYQAVRRCWRFGQKRSVLVDIVTTEGETSVLKNLQRKAEGADKMFSSLVAEMNNALRIERSQNFNESERVPEWL
jgi:superfamily II DNA/RNA helicase